MAYAKADHCQNALRILVFSSALSESKQENLIEYITKACSGREFIKCIGIGVLAHNLCDEIVANEKMSEWMRLLRWRFSFQWVTAFLKKHNDQLSKMFGGPLGTRPIYYLMELLSCMSLHRLDCSSTRRASYLMHICKTLMKLWAVLVEIWLAERTKVF